jgi:hypothetical protein
MKCGDVLKACQIAGQNQHYWFLKETTCDAFYDIFLNKEDLKHPGKMGQIADVKIVNIAIADDGTPGMIVELV